MFPNAETIKTNGVKLEVFHKGEGSPIVLCHGWPEHAYSWRHQIDPLVEAGYHVIIPNQRGYGNSSIPEEVEDYDIAHLTGDLLGLLDHFGHQDAVFVGHDWGAIVVWNLALMHPKRVSGIINLSVPFMERGEREWVSFWEDALGGDFYIVHFNRQPGVADAAFEENPRKFLNNLYRTEQWHEAPPNLPAGMPLISLAKADAMPGNLMMAEKDLDVFVQAFETSGFTGGINWYRNFSRNWHLTENYTPLIKQPTLMIYGDYDSVPKGKNLLDRAPNTTIVNLACGHWIQQEKPEETNRAMINWLTQN
ncbi:MAG: alpha/beta fold hydrolase [Candidatus Azotimanducaceae bacterium]